MKKRFTEEQIIAGAARGGGRREVAELLRKHGISEATFYNWRGQHGGMTVSDAKRLRSYP